MAVSACMTRKYFAEPGQRFGRLTVVRLTLELRGQGKHRWRRRVAVCTCDCGNENITVMVGDLCKGKQVSCGCQRREVMRANRHSHKTHGLSDHPLFDVWNGMMARCYKPQHPAYHNYGGRTDVTGGITVCPRWHDVAAFIEDIERIIGPRPEGMTLDRIRNGLGYKPSNMRWATRSQQNANQRPRRTR